MVDTANKISRLCLTIGEGGIFKTPACVSCILGSCVSVTFYVPRLRIGATFHAFLPKFKPNVKCGNAKDYVYVDTAINRIVNDLSAIGVDLREIEAKIFGGSSPLNINDIGIGQANSRMALEILDKSGVRVLSSSIGGSFGRKMIFMTHKGDVYIKKLNKTILNDTKVFESLSIQFSESFSNTESYNAVI